MSLGGGQPSYSPPPGQQPVYGQPPQPGYAPQSFPSALAKPQGYAPPAPPAPAPAAAIPALPVPVRKGRTVSIWLFGVLGFALLLLAA